MLIEDVSLKLKISKETLEKSVNMRKNKNIREKDETNGEILATLQEIRDLLKVLVKCMEKS